MELSKTVSKTKREKEMAHARALARQDQGYYDGTVDVYYDVNNKEFHYRKFEGEHELYNSADEIYVGSVKVHKFPAISKAKYEKAMAHARALAREKQGVYNGYLSVWYDPYEKDFEYLESVGEENRPESDYLVYVGAVLISKER